MQDIEKITNVIEDQESLLSKLEDCLSASAGRSSREPAFSVGKQSAILFRAMKTASFKQNFFEDLARKRGYIEELVSIKERLATGANSSGKSTTKTTSPKKMTKKPRH